MKLDIEDTEFTPKKSRKSSSNNNPINTTPKKARPSSTFTTPTGPRMKKALEVTPLPLRPINSSLLDSPYKLAQQNLHVSAVPSSLPCREEEYNTILEYLEGAIEDGVGACIYISGVPGIGKTATVREVVRALNERVESGVCIPSP
jgi:origin recognition complex subunit 1